MSIGTAGREGGTGSAPEGALPALTAPAPPAYVAAAQERLAGLVWQALTRPAAIGPPDLGTLREALYRDRGPDERALEALAALLYARPDLLEDSVIDALGGILRTEPLPERLGVAVTKVLRFAASSVVAARAWQLVTEILTDERIGPAARQLCLPLVEDFVQWNAEQVGRVVQVVDPIAPWIVDDVAIGDLVDLDVWGQDGGAVQVQCHRPLGVEW